MPQVLEDLVDVVKKAQTEIDRMAQEAEKYCDKEDANKGKIGVKNVLENDCFSIRDTVSELKFKGKFGAEDGELEPVAKLMNEKFDVSKHVARRKWHYGFALEGTNVDDEATLGVQYRIVGKEHVTATYTGRRLRPSISCEAPTTRKRSRTNASSTRCTQRWHSMISRIFLIRCIQTSPPASLARAVLPGR